MLQIHPNARTTPAVRGEIGRSKESSGVLARRYGVSTETIRKWRKRGPADCQDHSARPHRLPWKATEEERAVVCALRRATNFALDDLTFVVSHFLPHLNRDSVWRILRAEGLNRRPPPSSDRPKRGQGRFKDYDLGFVHIDIKHLPKLRTADGERRKRYLYVAIDRRSRSVHLAVKDDATTKSAIAFLREAAAAFPFCLTYVLTGNYSGPVHGQAQVEWLRKGRDYQVHLDVGIGPSFAPLITRRMSSQGQLTPDGIAPQRYDEETRFILREARLSSVFFLGGEVQYATGVREPVAGGAQDSASQFVQLTWLFLTGRETPQAGRTVQFPLVLPRRQYAWQYEVLGEEVLDTPLGPVASWHLKPTRAPASGDLLAEVWLAPSLQFMPVRLLIRQDAQNYVDLMLKSAPLQAAPESADGIPRRSSP